MDKEVLVVLGIFLVGLMGFVNAESSSITWVNFSVSPNNGSNVSAFNCEVEDLDLAEIGVGWAKLGWENCGDDRFLHNLIFLDRVLVGNVSGEFFRVSGLDEDTQYEFSIIPISETGEEGVRAVVFGRTLEKKKKDNVKKNGMREDVIPNFFVGESEILRGDVVIMLDDFYAVEDSFNWLVLFLWVLGFLIFVFLVLIFLVLAR